MISSTDLSPASEARFWELSEMLIESCRGRIEQADWQSLKRQFLEPSSDIREIAVVSGEDDLASVATVLGWEPFLDDELECIHFEPAAQVARARSIEPRTWSIPHALEMAALGIFRLIPHPEEIGLVPEAWRPFLVSPDEFDEVRNCRIIRGPHACFVSFAEEDGHCLGSRCGRHER